MVWKYLQIKPQFLEVIFRVMNVMMRMNAWMQQSQIRDHTQGKQRSRDESSHCQDQSSILVDYGLHLIDTQVPLILTIHEPAQSSLISIIHFGGFRFSPYRHPSSIDINGTWTGSNILNINQPLWWILGFTPDPGSIDINDVWTTQPRIKGLLRVTSMESRLRTTQRECTRV